VTVVVCGSLGATAAMWDGIDLGGEVVAVEHPGHGGEPAGGFEGVGGLAARVIERVPGRFSFVGVSLGGAVGLQLALDAPERLERLVVCCASARFGDEAQWHERAALVRAEGLGPIVEAVLERWFSPGFGDVQRFREMFLSVDPEGYARCCEALATWDVRALLPRLDVPTLCVAGEHDPTSPPAELEAIARAVGGRFEVIRGARHLAPVERPERFAELLG
jgi:3-oxoadipate enol-lactonase